MLSVADSVLIVNICDYHLGIEIEAYYLAPDSRIEVFSLACSMSLPYRRNGLLCTA